MQKQDGQTVLASDQDTPTIELVSGRLTAAPCGPNATLETRAPCAPTGCAPAVTVGARASCKPSEKPRRGAYPRRIRSSLRRFPLGVVLGEPICGEGHM